MSNLIVSLSPHIHGNDSIKRNMYGVVIALLPALLVSFYYFGVGAAVVCITSVVSCVFFECAINRYLLRNRNLSVLDGSAVITGLQLAVKHSGMDCRYRFIGCHRHRKNDIWRIGLQSV